MQTPIVDFAEKYAASEALRLHMPGHKGLAEPLDLTEIEGADVLYHANGIIRQSQENAASIFGTKRTVYSAEGSSLCIRAMVYLTRLYAASLGKEPQILAARNAHKTFVTSCALTDVQVQWLFPEASESLVSCRISAEALERRLTEDTLTAVYLTSPDYLGNIADVREIADICHRRGVLLLLDNAHGAYLRFLGKHPIELGADLCCDSAHKTLPVLTGGAYLHISPNAPQFFADNAELAMSLFASTSPSYLILQSLDAANAYLSDGYADKLAGFSRKVDALKAYLTQMGWNLCGDEVLKITLAPKSYGYTGDEIAELLRQKHIVCEFSDPDHIVLMLTPEITDSQLLSLQEALMLEKRPPITSRPPSVATPVRAMSLHEAIFAPSEELAVRVCVGRILAAPSITCPPAVSVLVCGERIDADAARCMQYYGIDRCRVIR